MESFESTIPLRYLPNVKQRVADANRKMIKRGAPPFVLEEVWRGIQTVAPRDDRDALKIPAVTVRISGEPFKIPGHSLVGVFYRGEDGEPNRLVGFGGHQFTPEQQNCDERCDHCKTKRERKALFFLKETESGAVKQVGGDCVEIYLGITPSRAINTIGLFDEALSILRMMEGEYWGEDDDMAGRTHASFDLGDYLASVAASIRLHGWHSVSMAGETNEEPTAHEAVDRLINGKPGDIAPEDRAMKDQVIAHWQSRFPIEEPQVLEEFDSNLKLIVHSSRVSKKSLGVAAWLVQGYQKVILRAQREMLAATSVHQGTPGDAIETVLRVNHRASFDTQYGTSYIFSMSDVDGNSYAWKTSSVPDGLNAGVITSVRAKIKGHREYKGVMQTDISHVKPEVRFADFPASPQEWLEARTQAFLLTLAEGWFNKSLAKGVDVPTAINTSTPPVLGLLIDRFLVHYNGAYHAGAEQAIRDAMKAGADSARLDSYKFEGGADLATIIKEHPELEEALALPQKKPRKRASPTMSM